MEAQRPARPFQKLVPSKPHERRTVFFVEQRHVKKIASTLSEHFSTEGPGLIKLVPQTQFKLVPVVQNLRNAAP